MISLYCAAKFAVEGFSESLAYELASQNIIVKIVEPSGGVSNTNFSNRMGKEQSQGVKLADYDAFVVSHECDLRPHGGWSEDECGRGCEDHI